MKTALKTFNWRQLFTWLWWWYPLRLLKCQYPLQTKALLGTAFTWAIRPHYHSHKILKDTSMKSARKQKELISFLINFVEIWLYIFWNTNRLNCVIQPVIQLQCSICPPLFLTLQLPWVTKTEFLLTTLIQYQSNKWWE